MTRWQRTLFILVAAQLVSAIGFGMFFPFLPLYVEQLGTNTGLSLEFWAGSGIDNSAARAACRNEQSRRQSPKAR